MSALNTRISGFYFAYYATVGAFMAYWAPYLVSRGLSPTELGITFALMGLTRATVPVLWGWVADRSGRRMGMIRAASVASLLLFVAIPLSDGVAMIMALTVAYTLFWNALLPQFEVVALRHLHLGGGDYSRVRSWGSVGFIIALMAVGVLIDRCGIVWEPWFVSLLFAAMAVSAWTVPDAQAETTTALVAEESIWRVLRRREVIAMLVVCFCSQFSFAPYYQFFTILMDDVGYNRTTTGLLWSLGVVAEIVMFMLVGRLIAGVGAGRLLMLVMLSTALRWLMIGWLAQSLAVLLVAQLLHAVSFAVYHSLAMHYIQRLFPLAHQGRGQALYSSASYGIGGSIGSLLTGWLWEHTVPGVPFTLAASVALLGAFVAWRWLMPDRRGTAPEAADRGTMTA